MTILSYKIFNKNKKLSDKNINIFIEEIKDLFSKFKGDKDIDNINVLKNKMLHLIETNNFMFSKLSKINNIKINKLIEKFNLYINYQNKKIEKTKLINVVKEIDNNYKKCSSIPNNKKNEYKTYCIKKR